MGVLVGFQLSADSVILSHRDLTHQVRLLHLLLHELLLLLLLVLVLGELLLLSVAIGRLLESVVSVSTEDARLVLVLSLLRGTHLLLLGHLLLHLLLRHTLADHSHSLVLTLHLLLLLLSGLTHVHLLLLLLRFGFLVASTEGERRATAGRGKDARG